LKSRVLHTLATTEPHYQSARNARTGSSFAADRAGTKQDTAAIAARRAADVAATLTSTSDTQLDGLRKDPRFIALLAKLERDWNTRKRSF